jgi:hypothetical protein
MGLSLSNKDINATYDGLLKFTDNQELLTGQKIVTDGLGNETALTLGRCNNGINISGPITSTTVINATNGICTLGTLNVAGDTNLSSDVYINGNLTTSSNLTAGNFKFTGTGTVLGNTGLQGALYVDGFTTLNDDTTIDGTLDITGNTTIGGTLNVTGDIIAFSTSDSRKKDNLTQLDIKTVFESITGYEFEWNEKSNQTGKSYGFIAQDVQKVLPELVREGKDGYLAVDYIKIIPFLFEKVKQLTSELEELKYNLKKK